MVLMMLTFEAWALVPILFARHLIVHEVFPESRLAKWIEMKYNEYKENKATDEAAKRKTARDLSDKSFDDRTVVRRKSLVDLEMLLIDSNTEMKKSTTEHPLLLLQQQQQNQKQGEKEKKSKVKSERRDMMGVVSSPLARRTISHKPWECGNFEDDHINAGKNIVSRYKPTGDAHAQSFRFEPRSSFAVHHENNNNNPSRNKSFQHDEMSKQKRDSAVSLYRMLSGRIPSTNTNQSTNSRGGREQDEREEEKLLGSPSNRISRFPSLNQIPTVSSFYSTKPNQSFSFPASTPPPLARASTMKPGDHNNNNNNNSNTSLLGLSPPPRRKSLVGFVEKQEEDVNFKML
jgi:hypothetical protein